MEDWVLASFILLVWAKAYLGILEVVKLLNNSELDSLDVCLLLTVVVGTS